MHDVNSCEPDSGNDIGSGAEETLKERNRRLLAKERERLKQRKPKIQKQRGKYKSCEDISKSIKVKSTAVIENHVNEGTMTRDENYSEQKEISRVDRRWELELISRMRDKIRTKVEKSGKSIVNRVVWKRIRYFTKVFAYAIRIFSSSASRMANMRSNRRFKPGD